MQDYLGMTGIGKSNLEFQEHVIKDLYYSQKLRKIFGDDALDLLSASTGKEYVDLIANIFDSTATVPEPENKSPTVSPFFVNFFIYALGIAGINFPK